MGELSSRGGDWTDTTLTTFRRLLGVGQGELHEPQAVLHNPRPEQVTATIGSDGSVSGTLLNPDGSKYGVF